jgi:serine O-acetyltransferase
VNRRAPQQPEERRTTSLWALLKDDCRVHGGLKAAGSYVSFWVVVSYRISHGLVEAGFDFPARLVQLAAWFLFRSNISRKAIIGHELIVSHPCGVMIGPHCRIGRRCVVGAGVFIGASNSQAAPSEYPVLHDGVQTGPGARIIGPVVVGDHVLIGPNVVVMRHVPAHSVVLPPSCHVVSREAWNNFKAVRSASVSTGQLEDIRATG